MIEAAEKKAEAKRWQARQTKRGKWKEQNLGKGEECFCIALPETWLQEDFKGEGKQSIERRGGRSKLIGKTGPVVVCPHFEYSWCYLEKAAHKEGFFFTKAGNAGVGTDAMLAAASHPLWALTLLHFPSYSNLCVCVKCTSILTLLSQASCLCMLIYGWMDKWNTGAHFSLCWNLLKTTPANINVPLQHHKIFEKVVFPNIIPKKKH